MNPKHKMLLIIALIMIPSLIILDKYKLYNPVTIGIVSGIAVLTGYYLTK